MRDLLTHDWSRPDVRAKVSATVQYSGDNNLAGMLHAVLVRSVHAHAKITDIDISAARELSGVVAIVLGGDIPHNVLADDPGGVGGTQYTQPVLAVEVVRYVGEPLAIVVACGVDVALSAADLIRVEYSPLPAVFNPLEALDVGSPQVHVAGNICVEWSVNKGDVSRAMSRADTIIEREYTTPFVDHAYLELESGTAWMDQDGTLVIRAATQVVEHYRRLADMLGISHSRVRVIAPFVGGGFGGKEDMTVEPYLALAVYVTQRPVRMVWTRSESLQARPKRHPMIFRYRVAAAKDGTILGMDIDITADAGAYALLTPRVVFAAAVVATGPYRVPNVKVVAKGVYTHNVPASAFRGFGAMQSAVAYEQIIEELAQALNLSPKEVRMKNFLHRGDTLGTGEPVTTAVLLPQVWKSVEDTLGPIPNPTVKGRLVGRGFAAGIQPYGRTVWFGDHAAAWIGIEQDGSVHLRAGVTDIGGGQAAVLARIAAEILGLPAEKITVHFGDSALNPLTGGTFATRQLYMSGNAVVQASRILRDRLLRVISVIQGSPCEEFEWKDTGVCTGLGHWEWSALHRTSRQEHLALEVLDTFYSETGEVYDNIRGTAARTFPDYTFGCHGCDVEVDPHTGQVQVLQYVAAHDVGRAINPLSVEGQIQGGVAQGIGYALMEEVLIQEGQCVNRSLAQYLIPQASDLPIISAVILESGEGKGPLNARGIGEPAISPVAPAIANAVANALGSVRVRSLPITAEKVIAALRSNP